MMDNNTEKERGKKEITFLSRKKGCHFHHVNIIVITTITIDCDMIHSNSNVFSHLFVCSFVCVRKVKISNLILKKQIDISRKKVMIIIVSFFKKCDFETKKQNHFNH